MPQACPLKLFGLIMPPIIPNWNRPQSQSVTALPSAGQLLGCLVPDLHNLLGDIFGSRLDLLAQADHRA